MLKHTVFQASFLRLCGLALGVGGSVVIARLGGAETKGVSSAFAAANSLVFLVVNLDLAQQILRDGRNRRDLNSVRARVMRLWIWYGLLAFASVSISFFVGGIAVWLALGTFAYLMGAQLGMIANALAGPVVASYGALLQQAGMILGAVIAYNLGGLNEDSVRVVVIVSYLAPLPLFLWKTRSKALEMAEARGTGTPAKFAALLRAGSLWQAARLAQFLMLRLDTLAVFHWLGAAPAGIYSVGLATAALAGILPTQFAANTTYEATMGTGSALRRNARNAGVTGSVASLGLAATGLPLILLAYGDEFREAYWVLLSTLPGIVAYGVLQVFTAHMRLVAKASVVTIPSVIGVLAMGVGLVALMPEFDLIGAGAASSIGALTAVVAAMLISSRARADQERPPLPSNADADLGRGGHDH